MRNFNALIDRIMYQLGERSLAQQAIIPCHKARDLLRGGSITISPFPEYRERFIFDMQVFFGSIYGGPPVNEYIAEQTLGELLGRMRTSIEELYPEAANGYQGGLSHIYDKITEQMIRKMSETWYSHVLTTEIDPVNYGLVHELLEKFLEKYSAILPSDLQRMPAVALMARWKETLVSCAGYVSQFEKQLCMP